jgi:DNA-binding SARP family transcriptional activator
MARHALEGELKSAADSHFILTNGQQIVLRAPGELCIDLEEFEHQAAFALKSEDTADFETAISLYRGDLLNEDLYEDWTSVRREQVRELHRLLLIRVSKIYESQGNYQQGIERLRILTATDPADEGAA